MLFLVVTQSDAEEYNTYINQSFGISIEYPTNILNPRAKSEKDDVIEFHSKDDEDVLLIVSGMDNIKSKILESSYQENTRAWKTENPRKAIKYKLLKDNWFVVSGFNAGVNSRIIFYQKTIFNNNQFKSFYFQYPESMKSFYDPIVKRMSDSFKG
jgi:hypothetical protein